MVALDSIPKFEKYKDSNVDWLGSIPSGWTSKRVKFIFKIGRGRVISQQELEDQGLYPVYSSQTKNNGVLGHISTYDFDCEQITWTTDGANAGTVFLRKGKHNCTNVCGTLQPISPNNQNIRFMAYSLSVAAQFYKRPDTNGAKIMNGEMADIFVTFPPIITQNIIANYLDDKTAKISEAITIKEQQIALLKERKQILVQQAVTRGLNSDVPMKDSGLDWIGKIPEHWSVKRAKYLLDEVDERSKTGEEELLSVSHMTGVTPRSEKTVHMFMAEDYTGSKLCREGDLVINIMWAWMGALGVSDRVGIVSPSYGVFRQKQVKTFHPKYLEYLLKTTKYIEYYNQVSTGLHSSRLRFYGHMLFNMKLGFPGYDEQCEIIDYLDEEVAKLDSAIHLQGEQIEKLKEYKTTLINSAVTGKIKVPGVKESEE
ncbi:MAG: restriction endonuclease subunit S [Cellvibrionaceae bacterium]|nr:restriction endonuclease subunit S [Cellvibrionaceae bacterium]